MSQGNPLVAKPQDQTTAVTGIGIAESAQGLAHGISNGDWVEAGLSAAGVGLEVLSMVIDPLGTLASYGVSWLIEHVRPLKEALDWFAGDPPVIQSFSETWANVAKEVNAVAKELTDQAAAGTSGWSGAAADAYRGHAGEAADAISGAGALADGISAGVMIMGEVVSFVREFIRDMVGELVGKLISWALETVATLGLATPVVVAQATAAISKAVSKISDLVRKLVKTISNVGPRIRKVISKLDEIMAKLGKLLRKADGGTPGSPGKHAPDGTTPSSVKSPDGPSSPDGTTSPSSATSPDGTTSPSSATHPSTTDASPKTAHSPDSSSTSPSSTTSPDGTTSPSSTGKPKTPADKDGPIRRETQDSRTTAQQADRRTGCGDPVDVVSGHMFMTQTDVVLPAALALVLRRTHISSYRVGRLHGRSWASTLDQRLEVDRDGVCFAGADGILLVYPIPAPGFPVLPQEGPRWPLAAAPDGTFSISQDTGQTLHFPGGHGVLPLSAVTDRNGNRVDVLSDDAGMPVEIQHSGGYRVAVDHNGSRIIALRLLTEPNSDGVLLMRYRYDEAGNLSEVINSSGLPQRFSYDAEGRVTAWQDRNDTRYRYHFDTAGRVIRTEGTGGILNATFTYERGVTLVDDSLGHRSEFHHNALGQIVRTVDPLGATSTFEWDRYDRLLSSTDPLGHTTRCNYDAEGRRTEVIRADGTVLRSEYNDLGLPTRVTDGGGVAHGYEYDDRGNLVRVTDRSGAVTQAEYDARGHLVGITDPAGAQTRIVTNAAGLPMVVVDPMGNANQYVRDVFGRPDTVIDPAGGQTRYGWAVEGQLTWRRDPDGATRTWRYDGEGNLVGRTDPDGRRTVIEVGDFGLTRVVITPDGVRSSTFEYDTEQRVTTVTNALGATWTYTYDPNGNLLRERDFSGRTTTYVHDAAGQLVSRTNGTGQTVTFRHDQLGRVIHRHDDASGDTTFTYSEQDLLTAAVNAAGTLTVSRDAAGTVLAESFNGNVLRFGYDPNGRRVRRITPSGAVEDLGYDPNGQLAVLRTEGRTIAFERDQVGREIARRLDGGITLAQRWDLAGRLTEQNLLVPNAPAPLQRRYSWRQNGSIAAENDSLRGTRRFEFDPAGRLTAVHGPGGAERYGYDPTGNLTHAAGQPDNDTQGPRVFQHGLIRSAGRTTYTHDGQGRVTEVRRRTLSGQVRRWLYAWDADDQLVEVTTPDGHLWRYHYDPLGRRCAKVRYAADRTTELLRVEFTWDGIQLAEQRIGSAVTTWSVEPRTARPVVQIDRVAEGDLRFHHVVTDHIGSPRELVDVAGRVAWRNTTTAWGAPAADRPSPAHCPLRFPGQYHDAETGLHYNMFRYYNPDTGQYLTPDPLGLAPSPNPYAYTTDPLRFIDPLGLTMCERFENFRRQVTPGEIHGAPPPYPGGRPGHAGSKHRVSNRVQADILNNPDRVFSGHYEGTNHHTGQPYSREVDVYFRDDGDGTGSVVITEAGNKNSVITAYGTIDTRTASPRAVDPEQWAGNPRYVEVNTSGRVNEVIYPNRERWERNDWP
ncbi:MAG TPA: RHS repeat-associated core domain-containing protein [Umezawaea sp.]|nr:RHS repeat-associated core domain-containing protein [Umezawaea sp.]